MVALILQLLGELVPLRGAGLSVRTATVSAMDWPVFLTTFFASSGAALIAFGSAAFAYSRTRRADRTDAALLERRERVGRVQTSVLADLAQSAGRWRGLRIGFGALSVNAAVTACVAAEWVEHEAVARWALERLKEFGTLVRPVERWWLLPGHQHRMHALMESASSLATALALWDRGALDDEWFADRLSDDERKALTGSPARRSR